MGDPLEHSRSSAIKHGGKASDYMELHRIMDSSKYFLADWRHRALLHNTFGLYLMENHIIGPVLTRKSDGEEVCTRTLVTQHILEDISVVPTPAEFLREMPLRRWMQNASGNEQLRIKSQCIADETQGEELGSTARAPQIKGGILWNDYRNHLPTKSGYYLVDQRVAKDWDLDRPVAYFLVETNCWYAEEDDIYDSSNRGGFTEQPSYWAEFPLDPVLDAD